MISVNNLSLRFGKKTLFKDVNISFSPGNCYGLIGANGSGKSTFLKILSKEIECTTGEVSKGANERLAILKQDQFAYDQFQVLETVIQGHEKLYNNIKERNAIYEKEDFSEKDGIKASELESDFADMNGWEVEAEAAQLLEGLGIIKEYHEKAMKDLEGPQKVRVLLAQALFGNPDILLLDEPTNQLDLESTQWLEEFLMHFQNTLIVVSHDRHFLNKVCTHIADIDFNRIQVYIGNYEFWIQASELALRQKRDQNRKKDDKIKELKHFISRFSANASKSKQATSRKKLLDKITLNDIGVSSRKYPFVQFTPKRECGKQILTVENLSKTIEGDKIINNLSFTVNEKDKIAFVGANKRAKSTLFEILMETLKPDSGTVKWGVTTTKNYFPKDNTKFFESDSNLVEWLRQFSTKNHTEQDLRGLLGRMLFTGEETIKNVSVLSGGEKVRCMLSKMMLSGANVLIFDEPCNHLDLESITSLNNSLIKYPEVILFSSNDHQFVNSIATRIIEFTKSGVIDHYTNFDTYIKNEEINSLRDKMNGNHLRMSL